MNLHIGLNYVHNVNGNQENFERSFIPLLQDTQDILYNINIFCYQIDLILPFINFKPNPTHFTTRSVDHSKLPP